MSFISTSSNSANLHLYYEKKLLETLEPRLVLYQLGMKQKLPKGNGKQVKWLRYSAIAESTSALTEGTPPSELSVSTANVTATVSQYGQFSKVTDLLSDTAIDPVVENLAERFGRAAAKTVEKLIVNELDSNAFVQRVNNRANDAAIVAGDVLNHKELIEAMIRMKADYIEAHEKGEYISVLHPLAEYDLTVDTQSGSWLDIRKYTDNKDILKGEIGRMYGMRFLVSDKMTTEEDAGASSTVDVISNYVIGAEAFGVVELNGQAIKMIRKSLGSAGAADPLDQYSTVGYKIHGFVPKFLDASSKRVIRIKSSSALGANT
jgi:N4-gp56 family major capsid protein